MAAKNGACELELPGLSRPFGLGMLYDCRSDKLIAGVTLWDKANIEKDVVIQPQHTSNVSIIASDTIDSKSTALDIDANLKLSFLCGLVSVQGSAKYLDDRKSSNHQSRITMQYKCTTVFKQLTMSHLGKGNVQHPDVFDQGRATHVVTGLLYGAQAFFVFDKQFSDDEVEKNVEGELHALVKALPCIKVDGDATLKMSEDEKKMADKLQIQFHGDFRLSANPTSYAEAVKLCKDLPNLLGPNQENAVPVKVWLYPLEYLDSTATRLVREISANLVSQTEKCLEQFHTLTMRCNDLANSHVCRCFQGIKENVSTFRDMVNNYRVVFTKQLMPILPKIRGAGAKESELLQVILNKEQSPFSHRLLVRWLNNCEEQIRVMERYISSMPSVELAANPGDLSAAIMDPAYRHCVCFNIQFTTEDQLQSAMEAYLKECNEAACKPDPVSISDDASFCGRLHTDTTANCRNFRNFHEANADKSSTTFIVAEYTEVTNELGVFIHLYTDGKLVDKNFRPPSVPGIPWEESSKHDELKLTWKQSDIGSDNITHYIVSYKIFGSDEWTVADTKDPRHTFTISKLIPATPYQIKVTAACEAGNSLDSDNSVVTTRPTNPPAQPKVWQASVSSQIGIGWEKPTIIGETVTVESYIIERCPMVDQHEEEWSQCGATKNTRIDVQQEFGTPYKYRVIAKCGEMTSLHSEPSESITITIDTKSVLKERVRSASISVGHSTNPSLFQVPLKKVIVSDADMIRKITFGQELKPGSFPEKVILLVGATGAGKTTFIDGILNYVLGVEWKDDYRFKLVEERVASNQAISQTKWISAYTLHHQEGFKIPYTLTIIDTPGFGDTTGIKCDKKIEEQLRHFFSTTGDGGIGHIDAIGLVTQGSIPRLTPSQKYIFDIILSLFGKNIATNIFLLITFGDGQKPPVLAGVKEALANLPYYKHFQFNNSALFATNRNNDSTVPDDDDGDIIEDDGQFDKMFWMMGVTSYRKLLKELSTIGGKILHLTNAVLEEKNQLQLVVVDIQTKIQRGFNKLEELRTEICLLKTHKADMETNESFTYTVRENKVTKVYLSHRQYAMNCTQCNFTCHYPCSILNDGRNKSENLALKSGNCTICPGKCNWTLHQSLPYKYDTEEKIVTKTADELKARYEIAKGKCIAAEKLIEKVFGDFTSVQMEVLSMTNEARQMLNRLKEIAIKTMNPLFAAEYIDILIKSEMSAANPGWQAKVEKLREARMEAETLAQVAKDVYDPFENYHEIVKEAKNCCG